MNRRIRMAHTTLLPALLAAFCTTATPDAIVDRFLTRTQALRIEDALTLVSDDVRIEWEGESAVQGRTALAARLRWDSVMMTTTRLPTPAVRGDTVILEHAMESNAWLQLIGIGFVIHEETRFVVRQGRITHIRWGPLTVESRQALETGLADFIPWARHEFPDRLDRIRPADRFDRQPRLAADWLALLRQWRNRPL